MYLDDNGKFKAEAMIQIAAAILSNPSLCQRRVSWEPIATDAEAFVNQILGKVRPR